MASLLMMNTSILNKGDALMNEAILRALGAGHDWSVTASLAQRNPAETKEFGIYLDSDRTAISLKQRAFNRAVPIAARGAAVLPRGLRRQVRLRLPRDIDAALDVSGYCFGDHWGQARVNLHTANYRRLREAGAKIVLMPKTWGPFKKISHSSLNDMFQHVDLAFARDHRSEDAIRPVLTEENSAKLFFAPDYTHGVAVDPISMCNSKRVAYLVPSRRVIDSGTMTQAAYYALFAIARTQLEKAGYLPYLLIHETSNDLRFIKDAKEMGFIENQIVVADNAVHAKSLIAGAELVITSRLHGLYNALNSAVPVIAVAWSYKYVEALRQYGCTESLLDLKQPEIALCTLIERLTNNPAQRASVQNAMRLGKARSAELSAGMWEKIKALIE